MGVFLNHSLSFFFNFLILKQQLGQPARELQEVFTILALGLKEYSKFFTQVGI